MTVDDNRIPGLDGIRGLAALYVVLHHCWLLSFPGYPANTGPGGLDWLVHGRFAVVVFITLSGFSLAVAPARHGWRLGGAARFVRRRALRILPAYWAALAGSAVVAAALPSLPQSAPPTLRAMIVHTLLLQDVIAVPTPNGAFWSIAVEAGLYLSFPLLLAARRHLGATATLGLVIVPVVLAGLLGLASGPRATGYTVELAPLFTLGMLAAGVIPAGPRIRRLPWLGLAVLAAAPVLTLAAVRGPAWTGAHYYWLDLAIGPAIAFLLAGLATGRPARTIQLLHSGPLRALGDFSYSLYLVHMPIVAAISTLLARPHTDSRPAAFWLTVALAVPAALITARVFAAGCETPFRRRREPT
ncbi:acyltransferase family protein [Catenuloplanes atrovinosus]|uniref:Peptidoglycan/LPS O-acetylase OafA/YrhL n=1 Tax=Catenuloplanes atrovinosus TaxID=137266 RepID=A0AAE3YLS2_9ACTN|nr:acyltransferase [Catenuloplanes atrovinosus]MDR7274191.1 peptidoglycan/LPS O-acetylase OafA/YrhL [Catenuloplanes atrovinosus]